MRKPNRRPLAMDRRGFSLLETLVAAFLLIFVFFGLAQIYYRGRVQLGFEEDRRKATAVAQARLDGIRRDFAYDDLPALAGTDTTYTVDNRTYTVSHAVAAETPEPKATTITLTVTWQAIVRGNPIDRTLVVTTILGRGLSWTLGG
jgi:Tfp pilus assembly protein PilV